MMDKLVIISLVALGLVCNLDALDNSVAETVATKTPDTTSTYLESLWPPEQELQSILRIRQAYEIASKNMREEEEYGYFLVDEARERLALQLLEAIGSSLENAVRTNNPIIQGMELINGLKCVEKLATMLPEWWRHRLDAQGARRKLEEERAAHQDTRREIQRLNEEMSRMALRQQEELAWLVFYLNSVLGWRPLDETFPTRAIHVGEDPDSYQFGPVVLPIYQTTTFKQDAPGKARTYKYSRDNNPTRAALEMLLASLDEAKHGVAFASGTAAISAVAELVANGGHVICSNQVFGGTYRYFKQISETSHNVSVTFIKVRYEVNQAEEIEKAIRPNTKMVWCDGLSNPLMIVCDIPKISEVIKKANQDIIFVVDNTFVTPYFLKPLHHGADIVIHSLTKYINGHSDVTGGAAVTNRQDIYDRLKFYQSIGGAVPSPLDCSQIIRGAKTLAIRMEKHMSNALEVAKFLEDSIYVERVYYPGLKSHPQHELAKSLWSGSSGMMTFYLNSSITNEKKADIFLTNLKVTALGMSLGGVQSLAELPFKMLDDWMTMEHRFMMGVSENMVRASIGIEDSKSIIEDYAQALDKIKDL